MRNELETYLLIDRYLNGDLPEGERLAVEERIHSDAGFAEEVEFQKLTAIVVQGSYQSNVRERVKTDLAAIDRKQRIIRRGMEGLMAILFIISIFWVYFSNVKQEKTELPKTPHSEERKLNSPAADSQVSVPNVPIETSPQSVSETRIALTSQTDKSTASPKENFTVPEPTIVKDSLHHSPTEIQGPILNEVNPTEKAAFDCSKIRLSFTPKITPSCENESGGIVDFDFAIQGGKAPYSISLIKNGKAVVNTQFYALASSNYTFTITDSHFCTTELTVFVPSKKCGINKFVFNPSAGEGLQIPLKENRPYLFTLRNRAGAVVYTNQYPASTHFVWEGISLSNQHQGSDLYIYAIEYDNGQQENGQITILK